MQPLDLRTLEVLGNVGPELATARSIRGALRMTVPQVTGRLTHLSGLGFVATQWDDGEGVKTYRLTKAGADYLAEVRRSS